MRPKEKEHFLPYSFKKMPIAAARARAAMIAARLTTAGVLLSVGTLALACMILSINNGALHQPTFIPLMVMISIQCILCVQCTSADQENDSTRPPPPVTPFEASRTLQLAPSVYLVPPPPPYDNSGGGVYFQDCNCESAPPPPYSVNPRPQPHHVITSTD
jgi:hypothetical protein